MQEEELVASFATNRGLFRLLEIAMQNENVPTNFTAHLVTDAVIPTVDTNTLSELNEFSGSGYAPITLNTTDFTVSEDDTQDLAGLLIKDLIWTASGGDLGPVHYVVICDDAPTPNVLFVFDLGGAKKVSDGQPLTVEECIIEARQP